MKTSFYFDLFKKFVETKKAKYKVKEINEIRHLL